MSKNCLETHCGNSGETHTSLSFSFPEEAKQTQETGLEAGDSGGRTQWARGQARPLGGTSPAAATWGAGGSGARGARDAEPPPGRSRPRDRARPGPRGALLPPHSVPLQPRTPGSRDGSRETGRPTHPPRPAERRTPGPKCPTFPEAWCGGSRGSSSRASGTPGAGRDDRVPSPRWVLPYSQWVSLR